ncbi:MAG TPA: hypothetical protein VFQ61_03270 [Polyangiaceae bacterium]|nr:hypothetical protein [Polyangiaceae bacterium]
MVQLIPELGPALVPAPRGRGSCRPSGTEGAVLIEYLVVFWPVLLLGMTVWQQTEIWMGELVVQRAATAAARAAAVVLPDDPALYGGTPVNAYVGRRRADIELAAALAVSGGDWFEQVPEVRVERSSSGDTVTATVKARFECKLGLFNLACQRYRSLERSAQFPYQGAHYRYSRP